MPDESLPTTRSTQIPAARTSTPLKVKADTMFSSTEMQDLGLGSLPDLDFAERLDGVYNNQDLVRDGQLEDEYSSLFRELEEFNDGLMRKEGRGFSTNFTIVKGEKVKSSGPNILSQAVTEAAIFENQLSPAGSNSDEDTDNSMLISEMETFLAQYESVDTHQETAAAADSASVASPLTADESRQAEDILDALIAGNIKLDPSMDIDEGNESNTVPDDSGYLSNISDLGNVSNISEVVTEDGQKVVIIITNDLEEPKAIKEEPKAIKEEPRSPENSTIEHPDSDSDWSPGPSPVPTPSNKRKKRAAVKNTKTKSGRVEKITPKNNGKKRGPYKLSTYHNIKDKKERKKAQNVEAARRYRDKKKAESDSVFAEEAQLAERNKKLRSKAAEIENEVKTLKKLMIELGLVK